MPFHLRRRLAGALVAAALLSAPAQAAERAVPLTQAHASMSGIALAKAPFGAISPSLAEVRLLQHDDGTLVLELTTRSEGKLARARAVLTAAQLETLRRCIEDGTEWPGQPPWSGVAFDQELAISGTRYGLSREELKRLPAIAQRYPDAMGMRIFESASGEVIEVTTEKDGVLSRHRHRLTAEQRETLANTFPSAGRVRPPKEEPPIAAPTDRDSPQAVVQDDAPDNNERLACVGEACIVGLVMLTGAAPPGCVGPTSADAIFSQPDRRGRGGAAMMFAGLATMSIVWSVLSASLVQREADSFWTGFATSTVGLAGTFALSLGVWPNVPHGAAISWAASRATLAGGLVGNVSDRGQIGALVAGPLATIATAALLPREGMGLTNAAMTLSDAGLAAGFIAGTSLGTPEAVALATVGGGLAGLAAGALLATDDDSWAWWELVHTGMLVGGVAGGAIGNLVVRTETGAPTVPMMGLGAFVGGVGVAAIARGSRFSTQAALAAKAGFGAFAGLGMLASLRSPASAAIISGAALVSLLATTAALSGDLGPMPLIVPPANGSPGEVGVSTPF